MRIHLRSRSHHVAAALLLSAALGACGSDSSVAPVNQGGSLTDAVAQLSIPAVGAAAALSGLPSAFPALDSSTCTYAAASQSFSCPTLTSSGLTLTQSFTLLDASGAKQSAYGATTTAAVQENTALTGTFARGGTNVGVDAQQQLTLSGLLGDTRTLDGGSTTTLTNAGSLVPSPRTVVTTTIDKLVIPAGATGATGVSAWPTSGTITAVTTSVAGGDVPPIALLTVKIAFTGSSHAAVTVTAAGFTKTCTVDLSSQAPSCT